MAITLEEWARRLEEAERTTFPKAIREVLVRAAFVGERTSKQHATGRPGPASRSGRLRSSIRSKVRGRGLQSELVLSANTPYARLQEKGGVIRPVHRKWLTIPTAAHKTQAGVARSSAPNTPGLFFAVGRNSGLPFLGRRLDDGSVEAVFLLRKRAKVPARPYLRPGIDEARKVIPREIEAALKRLIGVPNG